MASGWRTGSRAAEHPDQGAGRGVQFGDRITVVVGYPHVVPLEAMASGALNDPVIAWTRAPVAAFSSVTESQGPWGAELASHTWVPSEETPIRPVEPVAGPADHLHQAPVAALSSVTMTGFLGPPPLATHTWVPSEEMPSGA